MAKVTKVMLVGLSLLALLLAYSIGENNGRNAEKGLVASAYQSALSKQVTAVCGDTFGSPTQIESVFGVPVSLDVATSNVSGQVVCAYNAQRHVLVLIAVDTKPSSLIGKNHVTSENEVTYHGTHGQVWVLAASTNPALAMTRKYDAYLFTVATKL
jgi:hypothetical protein